MAPLESTLAQTKVDIVPFSEPQPRFDGQLRPQTRPHGLSLGDRACLARALERGLAAVTADAAWRDATAASVPLIRQKA